MYVGQPHMSCARRLSDDLISRRQRKSVGKRQPGGTSLGARVGLIDNFLID